MKPVRTFGVTVRGYPEMTYSARSPGKARARCYRDYCSTFDNVTFKDFLSRSTVRVIENPPGVGERIIVLGRPATRCFGYGANRIYFMRDDEDVVLCAHPSDVAVSEGIAA